MPQFYTSPEAKPARLPFSQAVRVGDVLYLSGQIGNLPGKMELAPGGMEGQTRQMMENIGAVLKANGLSFDDVFKCLVMMARHEPVGRLQQGLCPVLQAGPPARPLGLRRQRAGAGRGGRDGMHGHIGGR